MAIECISGSDSGSDSGYEIEKSKIAVGKNSAKNKKGLYRADGDVNRQRERENQ